MKSYLHSARLLRCKTWPRRCSAYVLELEVSTEELFRRNEMFERNDEQYLIGRLSKNSVLLFLGAGFSREAKNQLGTPIPTSEEFAKTLWNWLGYKDPYDGTSLQDMYDAVLTSGRPEAEISRLLESHLLCDEIPPEYIVLVKPFWYRIYTTNVDDLVEGIYASTGEPKLTVLSHPRDEIADRDQTLALVQLLHLNGKLPGRPSDITFSMRQYAKRAGSLDPLYYQFVQDYATHATVFVGTEMNEPLLWQYIELRSARPSGISENRPNSFLITPNISPPKRARLKAFNVIPVEADTAMFLGWLNGISKHLPSRSEILEALVPDIALAVEASRRYPRDKKALVSFSNSFHRVPVDPKPLKDRSTYLLGASPRWEDIHADLDAPRDLTAKLEARINQSLDAPPTLDVVAILGSAGSGKSTILRRLGLSLARAGRLAFLTNSEELLSFPPNFAFQR